MSSVKKDSNHFAEIEQLQNSKMSFIELKKFFQNLADQKGAVYAFEVLKRAQMPPNTDMHLMGHAVGEILYKQYGAEGLKYCTQDFRNACSHTIVVGLLLDKGESALEEISQVCKHAPGGRGAYTMCYHGLGHGVLAYTDYNFSKTVALCKQTGTQQYSFREYGECVGGAVMEQISGGDHDRATWEKQRIINLKKDDPLYPCNSDIISDAPAKTFCYMYLTPHLFNLAGENFGGRPTDETIKKAFTYCENLPEKDSQFKKTCYGGFGKEFVVLAKDRDIRKIEAMTEDELMKTYNWCKLAGNSEGLKSCIEYVAGSLYWGGENDSAVGLKFCALLSAEHQPGCYENMIANVKRYKNDKDYVLNFCQKLPGEYLIKCAEN